MVILLVGASGLLGGALQGALSHRRIRQLVRRPPHPQDAVETVQWAPPAPPPLTVFDGVSAVVNLGGAGVGDKRWTRSRLQLIRSSRTGPTHALAHALAQIPRPIRYLQASAVGYYGDTGEALTDENAPSGATVLANICREWESAATPALGAGHPTAFLRTGIVLTPAGGALTPLLRLIKLGLGGPLGNGRQWWPWIHLEDWVRAAIFLLEGELEGPVNLTAPNPATNREITRQIARAHHRPALLPAPAPALRLALGGFSAEILRSQRVVPRALLDSGFAFTYPEISSAAHALTS